MAGLATALGSGAMTNSLSEIENNDLIFVIGSNTTETHPIVGLKMKKAIRKGARLIVADPREIDLVRFAHLWLRLRPGTDVALLNSIMHVILKEGLADKEFIEKHTVGFEEYKSSIDDFSPEIGEKITGIPKDDIIKAALLYGNAERPAIYYTMGVTQHSHGTDNVLSIANLALLTGNLGKESTGVNPLRGQNNVQGASDMGCSPNLYPGYQRVDSKETREKFERLWKAILSEKPGLTATEMIEAAIHGDIKAMYIMGENPVLTDPNMSNTIKAFNSLQFMVVQDIFFTETASFADVVLPAASFAEKDGTFTNTERRVQRVRKAVEPPGEAKEDLWIIIELSKRLGYKMQYESAEDVMREIGQAWPLMAGITYSRLEKNGIQWPCPSDKHHGTPYLFKEGFPIGKGRFSVVNYKPPAELPDDEYPFILSTGRQLFQYHTGTMTRKNPAIESIASKPYIEINPDDAKRLNISDGQMIKISSKRGSIKIAAKISKRPLHGMVFLPFHYKEAAANILTNDKGDPVCKIPELKVCAVKIEALD